MTTGVPFCMKPDNPKSQRWYVSQEQQQRFPSIRRGMSVQEELKNRQRAADFINTMGEKLNHNIRDPRSRITNLCICAAMVHMHRFYVFHPFQLFDPRDIGATALFLAGKVEECPRKLEYIVLVWHRLKNPHDPHFDPKSEKFHEVAQYLVTLENILLQTIGFDLEVNMPHTDIIKGSQRLLMGKETEVAYWMASDILSMSNYCIRYRPSVLACVAIHMTGVWRKWEPPTLPTGEQWFKAFDKDVTPEILQALSAELMQIMAEVKASAAETGGRPRVQSHLLKFKQKGEAQIRHEAGASTSESKLLHPPPPPPTLLPPAPQPGDSSPIKRVKTEPTVLNIDKYLEKKGKALPTTAAAAPVQKKSFMPDTSANAISQMDPGSFQDLAKRPKQKPPGASAHFNAGSGRNSHDVKSERKRASHPEWNETDWKRHHQDPLSVSKDPNRPSSSSQRPQQPKTEYRERPKVESGKAPPSKHMSSTKPSSQSKGTPPPPSVPRNGAESKMRFKSEEERKRHIASFQQPPVKPRDNSFKEFAKEVVANPFKERRMAGKEWTTQQKTTERPNHEHRNGMTFLPPPPPPPQFEEGEIEEGEISEFPPLPEGEPPQPPPPPPPPFVTSS